MRPTPPGAPFDGRHFRNAAAGTERGLAHVLRWMRTRQPARWPDRVSNSASPQLPASVDPGTAVVTFVNHSTFLLQTATTTILTDPVFGERASPVPFAGPRRVRPPGIERINLPAIDFVALSHNHYDHLELSTLRALRVPIITTLGNRAFLRARGLEQVDELDWWQRVTRPDGTTVTLTPAQHFSARTPFDRNRTLWGGFVIESGGVSIFFAGDSGYAGHFREVRERCGRPDLALLPIGAYAPRWFMQPMHMNPAEAVRTHLDLDARASVAMHFGCFQLTDEPFDEPVRELANAREAAGVDPSRFRTLEVGESALFDFRTAR